jgi:hypothetical protein
MLPAWIDSGRMHDHSAARLQEFHMAWPLQCNRYRGACVFGIKEGLF